ncbi:translation initiation factor IF-2, partial [Leptospira ellinghausenii]
MEEQKSIKETLQQGASGDKTKKKLVIKKKAAPSDEKKESGSQSQQQAAEVKQPSTSGGDKKKDLNELIREEAKRQGLGSGPQAPSQASPIVSRPDRKPDPLPQAEREKPQMDRKPESILSGDTSSPNYRSGGGQGGGNQGYFRKEDRNPIVSRPTTPRPQRPEGQGGGYQGNRGPGQGGGYQGNRGPGQGGPGGGYQG